MTPEAIKKYVVRIESAIAAHGNGAAALCDGKGGRGDVRFPILAGPAIANPDSSVLDVGCGYGDLRSFLREQGWQGKYMGIDIVPALLQEARIRHPDAEFRELDGSAGLGGLPPHDFVIASGLMNLELPGGGNEAHIRNFMACMFQHARVAVSIDFMSSMVDFKHPDAWHTDPAWALQSAFTLTRRVVLRADYMPYEFCLIMYKDASISGRNVFQAWER